MQNYQSLPFREQVTFFRNKVNVPTATWRDVWRDQHDKAFMVAGAAKADLLADFNQAIDRAIAEGTTIEQFRKDFDRIVEQYGWSYNGGRGWRTRVIYETNLRTSYQAGRYAQLTNPKLLASRPYLRYKHSDSVQHPRPLHVSWDGLILRHDDPWWRTHYPPNGWGCKCKVFAESERTMRRRGKLQPDQAPGDTFAKGRPDGIDEGWDYAPGASVAEQTRLQIKKKADKLPTRLQTDLNQALNTIPDPAPLPDRKLPKTTIFSTAKKVSSTSLNALLSRIPDAEEQIDKLSDFIDAAGVKSLFIKSGEMGRGNTAYKLKDSISEYLGVSNAWGLYYTGRASRVNGFTFRQYRHVVIKTKASDDLSKVDATLMKQAVDRVIEEATRNQRERDRIWSIRESFNQLTEKKQPGHAVTWLHEVAHQIHFAAGAPRVPEAKRSLTHYGSTNAKEWHAEHIAAWVLNRSALEAHDPELVEYLDQLVDNAIKAVQQDS